MLLWIALGASLGGLLTLFYVLGRMRPVDRVSLGFAVARNAGFLNLLQILGIRDRMRPKLTERIAPNGHRMLTSPMLVRFLDLMISFKMREDDVFVATYLKSGTTWMQEIVWLICHNADIAAAKKDPVSLRVPFFDMVDMHPLVLGIQTLEKWPVGSQRVMKTHVPYDFLPEEVVKKGKGKIIYVARNPKDVCVSYYHFQSMYFLLPLPGTWNEHFTNFSSGNVAWGSWFSHILKYWEEYNKDRNLIYFTTYEALSKDLHSEIVSIAKFLGKELTASQIEAIANHCTFASMSKNKNTNYTHVDIGLDKTKSRFMRKGKVGDWKNYFTISQNEAFDRMYEKNMGDTGLHIPFEL